MTTALDVRQQDPNAQLTTGLRWAVEACRSGQQSPAGSFAQGAWCLTEDLERFIPRDILNDLISTDMIRFDAGRARLAVTCANFNNLVSVMPPDQEVGGEFVHLNSDSFWLLRLIWQHTKPGDFAVELGTGNGIVAAHLVARYQRVLGTDLPGPWMRYARLTLAANAGRGRPSGVVACDVGSALRPASFDLVAANTPWSPSVPVDDAGKTLTFMAGGPTGTELPTRFLRDGARLLRPGGTAITLCFDPEFEDGSRPLVPVLDELVAQGYGVECVESKVFATDHVTSSLRRTRLPTLKTGSHIAVIVRA